MEPIRATYRLQLEPAFGFDHAAGIVPYLAALGVSHVYCSPVFEAVPGSRHGYDIVDPTRVRGELGGAEARARFVATLREHGLGLIADIVPNHVALEGNAWWIDVLTHGTASASFPIFDVDLSADPYAGPASAKLLIPILGEPYGRELAAGRLRLVIEQGKPLVAYARNRFPLSITSRAALDDEPEGQGPEGRGESGLAAIVAALNADRARMHALLEAQHYRLTWWRLARDETPYRRFFDVNGLIGVRVEDPAVFDAMHRLVAEWVADGSVDGLRVDHVDGLADPGAYLRRLRALAPTQWIGIEKILAEGEALPPWPVDGTTGYETGALLTRLLTAAEGEGPLTALYHRFAGALDNFDEVEEDARHEILEHWLAGDAKRVALALYRMCQDDLDLRDYSLRDASILIRELVAGARVYRTYVSTEGATDADVARLAALCDRARTRRPDVPEPLIDLVARLFATGGDGPNGLEFVRRFQQLSTATAAKAVEDTAAYRDVRYIALNEVGSDPRRFSATPSEFHDTVARWQGEHPRGMHGTSTHDSKRGEDVRARLSLLSEVPELWAETVERWGRRSDAWRVDGQPDRNMEYYIYQTLVGAWPLTPERAHAHVEKAAREAKVFTDWLSPSEEYEGALHHFVDDLFGDAGFIAEVAAFVDALHPADWIKGLSQQLLKLTIPGVPDLYQGSELWHRALVDPDNRRPVDYKCRAARLEACDRMTAADVLARLDEGLPKLWTTSRALRLKARHPALADPASAYAPLEVRGPAAARAVGFLRGGEVAVVVPIRTWAPQWTDTQVRLPDGRWHHVLADMTIDGGAVDLEALFGAFPVALLERKIRMTTIDGPLGATLTREGVHFRVFSSLADRIELCLFDEAGEESRYDLVREPGFIWHLFLPGITAGQAYGFRVHGPYDPACGLRCNPAKLLTDPYAKALSREITWGHAMFSYPLGGDELAIEQTDSAPNAPRSYVVDTSFDWGRDRRPGHWPETTVIYELHVKGFTRLHPAVPEHLRGTYKGLATPAVLESIRKQGITTVELMPVHQFMHEPGLLDEGFRNYWGYHTYGFFAPHAEYAAADDRGGQVREFKEMVKAFHAAGLEVILDVVYNHTSEGNHLGPHLNFKGFDNPAYYHLVAEDRRYYMDYTGTGNSVNLRHPYVLQLVMDSLRYWVTEMHVDGFRFDLAATLARGAHTLDTWSAFFATIHQDPVLQGVKLIAEPWDTGTNGYQVGNFPYHWSEWNDRYRESVRGFWRNEPGRLPEVAARLTGSIDLFKGSGRRPSASINYIASHDGLTLNDLAGGDMRLKRNLLTTVLLSMGTPMIGAGDEWGRSQQGNDNAYNQDNEISWLDWSKVEPDLQTLVRHLIRIRPSLPWVQKDQWAGFGLDIRWLRPDGAELTAEDWEQPRGHVAMYGWRGDARALLLLNATHETHEYQLPPLEKGAWRRVADTARDDAIRSARPGMTYKLQPSSVVVIVNAPERVS